MSTYNKITYRRISTIAVIWSVIAVMVIIGQGYINYDNSYNFSGEVSINNINMQGMSRYDAEYALSADLSEKIDGISLNLIYKDKSWNLKEEDFKDETAVHTIISDAYEYEQRVLNNSASTRVFNLVSSSGFNIDVAFAYVFKAIEEELEGIIREIEASPTDAKLEFNPNSEDMFKIVSDENGIKVNRDKLYKDIQNEFLKTKQMNVEIETIETEANLTSAYYKDKTALVGNFNTDLSTSKEGRKHNVALALSKFNGLKINAGETISFNKVTGPQTLDGGYKKSIIIHNGIFIEGVGGGICQASTTLYNALLLANIEIVEVNKHTLPIGYVEPAFDAMVSEYSSDLIFKNNSKYPIYIKAYVKNGKAHAEVYGKTKEQGLKIVRRSEITKKLGHLGDNLIKDTEKNYKSHVMYEGELFRLKYPKQGYEAVGYLDYYKNGKLINSKLIRSERYEPTRGIVIEGATPAEKGMQFNNGGVKVLPPQPTEVAAVEDIAEVIAVIKRQNPTNYSP